MATAPGIADSPLAARVRVGRGRRRGLESGFSLSPEAESLQDLAGSACPGALGTLRLPRANIAARVLTGIIAHPSASILSPRALAPEPGRVPGTGGARPSGPPDHAWEEGAQEISVESEASASRAGRWLWRSAFRNGTAAPRVCGVFSSGLGGEVWEEGTEERPAEAGAPSVGAGSRMCHSTQDHRRSTGLEQEVPNLVAKLFSLVT
nr:uncharacterized protein LOC127492278 [Oryctolagus cuniculus]